ncbi:hypothetical protein DFH07DRAFT_777467 [Mycena maculata]|uniref:Uncharacterized protein n=1 Tax=Mycena maculata TaxID=230809 RepID=A0AAD7IK96_9AGAR|nr:hypothetical protein DFH07DRAFT_777467 [Mycena maculata]
MAKGQFTKEQNNHIESFFSAFAKEMDKGVTGVLLTRWKQTHASNIMDSPLFSTLDLGKFPRKTCLYEPLLFQMIARKFTNYRNQVYLKSDATQLSLPVSNLKKSNPLLKFSSLMTGRELFARENNESIAAAVTRRSLDTGNKNSAAVYQTVLKEKWDSLSGEDQAHWSSMAEAEAGDVAKNQEEFPSYINLALRDLCQGKVLGDAEMLLFYAFREPTGGDLMTGTREELELHYGQPWSDFVESVIPRPATVNPLIPRNSNGQPVFPSIDMNGVAIGDMRMLLSDYFDQCWAHQHSNSTSIPWEDIVLNPAKYCAASNFSTTLDHPQNLSTVQVVNLVNDLLSTSTIKNPTPFHFLATEGTVLVPETPPVTPAVVPTPPPPSLLENRTPETPVAPASLGLPPASPSAVEVEEAPPAKTRGKNKRQRTLDDPDKTADNGRVKRKKSKGTEPDTASIQGRGKSTKRLRIKNSVGAVPGIAAGAPKKKAKSRGWAWVDSDGNVGGFGRK